MIRFGSRTEICLPLDAEISVRVGQKVKGGSTVLARLATVAPAPGKQHHETSAV
jgi:phosphatidylserine decarboxylase